MHVRSLEGKDPIGSHLGLLVLPLAATGLVFGRSRVRAPLFVMLVVAGAMLIPFASSPVLAPLLVAFPVLGTYNHFGDQFYDGCGFLLLVFAAGLGLEAAERQRPARRWLAIAFFGFALIALPLFVRLGDPSERLAGFLVLVSAGYATLLVWASRLPARSGSRLLGAGVVALTLVDVGVVSLWTLRPVLRAASPVTDAELGSRIGSATAGANVTIENYVLKPTEALIAARVDVSHLPNVDLFCAAHVSAIPPAPSDVADGFGTRRSLGMPVSLRADPVLAPFLSARPGRCEAALTGLRRDYDSIRVSVRAAQPTLLFVKDAWSPEWRADVDGAEAPILPAWGAFKAVAVPAGASVVQLRFSPPGVGVALLGSYALLLGVALLALFGFRRTDGAPSAAPR